MSDPAKRKRSDAIAEGRGGSPSFALIRGGRIVNYLHCEVIITPPWGLCKRSESASGASAEAKHWTEQELKAAHNTS